MRISRSDIAQSALADTGEEIVSVGKAASWQVVAGISAASGIITFCSRFNLSGRFCRMTRPTVVPGAGTFQMTNTARWVRNI